MKDFLIDLREYLESGQINFAIQQLNIKIRDLNHDEEIIMKAIEEAKEMNNGEDHEDI